MQGVSTTIVTVSHLNFCNNNNNCNLIITGKDYYHIQIWLWCPRHRLCTGYVACGQAAESIRPSLCCDYSATQQQKLQLTLNQHIIQTAHTYYPHSKHTRVMMAKILHSGLIAPMPVKFNPHTRSRWLSSRTPDCSARGPRFESHRGRSCLSRQSLRYTALGTGCAPLLQCLCRLSLPPSVGR